MGSRDQSDVERQEREAERQVARLLLYWEGARHFPDLGRFARLMLRELSDTGLVGRPHSTGTRSSVQSKTGILRTRSASGQGAFVQLDAYTELADGSAVSGVTTKKVGFRAARILDAPLRTDAAIVAALSVIEARREAEEGIRGSHGAAERPAWERAGLPPNLDDRKYAVSLLRYFKPGFDAMDRDAQAALIEDIRERAGAVAAATDLLMRVLDGPGAGGKLKTREAEDLDFKLRAAQLKDIGGYSYRELARVLGGPEPTQQDDFKNDHRVARKWADAGRSMLREALGGEAAYNAYCAQKRAEAEAFGRLSSDDRRRALVAYSLLAFGGTQVGRKASELLTKIAPVAFARILGRVLGHR